MHFGSEPETSKNHSAKSYYYYENARGYFYS